MRTSAQLRLAAVASAFAALLTACGGSAHPASSPSPSTTSPVATTPPATGPSQSAADAKRDGVIAALAALPFSVRVGITAELVAPEGIWALSRPTAAAAKAADGCRLGPETGQYPKDTICVTEYGELLLLSSDRARIVRAYPLPSVPGTYLRLTPAAVYCGRAGDTTMNEYALPDAMACRVDRRTLRANVRVFAPGDESEVLQPCFVLPANWAVTNGRIAMRDLVADASGVWAKQADGRWTRLHPTTLEVLARNVSR